MSVIARFRWLAGFVAASALLIVIAPMGRAARTPPPTTPFVISPENLVNPLVVPPGTWLMFHFAWGWSSEPGTTVPENYEGGFFDGGHEFVIELDGQPILYTTRVEDVPNVCAVPFGGGDEVCHDATFVHFERLHRPLPVGEHTVTFRLTSLKEFPDDGWGFAVPIGVAFDLSNTLTVKRRA